VFWFYKHGALESFKVSHSYLKNALVPPRSLQLTRSLGLITQISTNRGRSCHFRQKESDTTADFVEKPIMVAPGTTINGFYWSQVRE
jgi:hypothetical protein